MPTQEFFNRVPPFPSNIPTAEIPLISFKDLANASATESKKLFQACRELGIFSLDLRNSGTGEQLLKDAEALMNLTTTTLSLDRQILDKFAYNPPHNIAGYKRSGKLRTADGKLDSMETYSISQDDMVGNVPPRENPEPIEHHRTECRAFFEHARTTLEVIYAHLEENLGLPPNTLAERSALNKQSDTFARLLVNWPQTKNTTNSESKEPRVTLGGHADMGALTMLFNVSGGLQILPKGKENVNERWEYVRPRPGCALIDVGDSLMKWTGGVLHSAFHRVVTAPGEQGSVARQSVALLTRPDRSVTMQRIKGSALIPPLKEGEVDDDRSASDWIIWKITKGELRVQTAEEKRVAATA
ncbi:oxidoreductase [Aspergillus piperis CBS 112811]|uniref:Oxidoreductase n=1 Tax=Aspergillus piperis CBS 112811 TaxID=1448313 RepID=A0A8G1RBB8_9EURO|nr:oxidoreductase [Aspergillus piperis CBS 112811]RAH62056.1 oxidoreductase [Aspergillus piperis CBS 112811]